MFAAVAVELFPEPLFPPCTARHVPLCRPDPGDASASDSKAETKIATARVAITETTSFMLILLVEFESNQRPVGLASGPLL